MADRSKRIVRELFQHYIDNPDPDRLETENVGEDIFCDEPYVSSIKDYIAGMTDRYAVKEHERIFGKLVI